MSTHQPSHAVSPKDGVRIRLLRIIGVAALAVTLGGCAFASKPPLGVVDLPMPRPSAADGAALALQLVVMEPQASALLDSPRIMVRDRAGQVAQLAGVALPDRAPRWLQGQLLQGLSAHPFAAVSAPGAGLRADLQLLLRLERFELDYRAAGEAEIALHAVLLDASTGRALASARFDQQQAISGSGSQAGAEALQRASFAAISALADWAAAQARESAERSD